MHERGRTFLDDLLATASPSGFETPGQRVWVDYVREFAADVSVDGFLRIARIGGADRTVSKGQHVTVHADEPVQGVIGQTAIHLRDSGEAEHEAIAGQFVGIGATDAEEARGHVEVGDPVSTVQKEVGLKGAQMVGVDLDTVDAFVAVDVTHATDNPDVDTERRGPVEIGAGPVIARGSANHPSLVALAREAAANAEFDVQLQAAGTRTGTDADAFYTARGGIQSLNVSIPNRYTRTPVEVVDLGDLDTVADLLAAVADGATAAAPFAVDV